MFKTLALALALTIPLQINLHASHHFVETTPPLLGEMGIRHETILANLSNTPRPKLLDYVRELSLEYATTESDLHDMQLDYLRSKGITLKLKEFPGIKHVYNLQSSHSNGEAFFMTHDIDAFVKSLSKETVLNQKVTDFQLRYMIYRLSTAIFYKKIILICATLAKERKFDFFNYMEDAFTSEHPEALEIIYNNTARVRYLHSLSTQHSPAFNIEELPFFKELETEAPKETLLFVNVLEPTTSDFLLKDKNLNRLFNITGLCALESTNHFIFSCMFNTNWIGVYKSKANSGKKTKKSSKKKQGTNNATAIELLECITGPLKAKVLEFEETLRQQGKSDEYINNFIKSLYDNVLQAHALASKITSKEILDRNAKLKELNEKQNADLQQVNATLKKVEQSLQKQQNVTANAENQVKSKVTRIQRLEKKLEAHNAEVSELKEHIKSKTDLLNNSKVADKNKFDVVNSELAETKKNLEKAEKKKAKLLDKMQQEMNAKETINAKFITAQTEMNVLKTEALRLNLENNELVLQNESLSEQLFSAGKEIEKLRAELQQAVEQAYTNGVEAAYKRMQAQVRADAANTNETGYEEVVFIPKQFE